MKKILVALDGSTRDADVLDASIRMAVPLGASLVLLRVVGMKVDFPLDLVRVTPEEFEHLMEEKARDALVQCAKAIPAEVRWEPLVVTGVPWKEIGEVAKSEDVDLVVIGAHGYGGLDRLLGTTAARIVNHADRSVLVVRAEARLIPDADERRPVHQSDSPERGHFD